MKDSTIRNKVVSSSLFVSFFLVLIFGWIIISSYYDNEMIFPSIKQILNAFLDIFKNSESLKAIGFTILRVIISVLICFVVGFLIITLYILFPTSLSFFKPLIQMMRSMPLAIISIFLFILIGDKIGPYVITILMSLPVVFEGLLVSTNEIDQNIKDELTLLSGSKLTKIRSVYLPTIAPYIMMTLIQTLGMSFKVMIMGEYICQTRDSIGKMLYAIKMNIEMDKLIAYGILIIIIVSIFEFLLKYLKNKKVL